MSKQAINMLKEASAIIDRIVHHASIIKIIGSSYRIKNYKDEISENEKNTKKP